jgi:membrane-associated phospholipid phosphatase
MKRKIQSGAKKLANAIALLSAELLLVFIIFFISLATLIVIIRQIFYRSQNNLDESVFNYLSQHVTKTNTVAMQWLSFIGSHLFLVPAFLLFFTFIFFRYKSKWYFIKAVTAGVSNLLLMFGLKFFFNRPRPLIPLLKEVPGLSFPSGHAFMSLTFFGLIIYFVYRDVASKWIKWTVISFLILIIFLVGLSRVYLRVHYSSDVIAGFCFGILSLVILFLMLRQIEKFNAKKMPDNLSEVKNI